MAEKPYLDHRQIKKWQEDSKRVLPLAAANALPPNPGPATTTAHMEPLIPSQDGYVLTADDRLAFRFMLQSQAQKLGVDGLTVPEAYALIGRLENLPAVEEMALLAQRDMVKLRRAAGTVLAELQAGKMPTAKQIVDLAIAMRETE